MLVANKMIENLTNEDNDICRITLRTYAYDGLGEPTSDLYQVDCYSCRQLCQTEEFETIEEARQFAQEWLAGVAV